MKLKFGKDRVLIYSTLVLGGVFAYYHWFVFNVAEPTPAELLIAQNRWPEETADSLYEGYKIFTSRCVRCHGLKNVGRFSEAELGPILKKMVGRAKLNAEEKINLERYVLTEREYLLSGKPKRPAKP